VSHAQVKFDNGINIVGARSTSLASLRVFARDLACQAKQIQPETRIATSKIAMMTPAARVRSLEPGNKAATASAIMGLCASSERQAEQVRITLSTIAIGQVVYTQVAGSLLDQGQD
jgi:hypothetical protein